jgi:hypothetical protein
VRVKERAGESYRELYRVRESSRELEGVIKS